MKKLDDYEYGEIEWLRRTDHDSSNEEIVVITDYGDHGITRIESYDRRMGDSYGLYVWAEDMPALIEALVNSYNHQAIYHRLELTKEGEFPSHTN